MSWYPQRFVALVAGCVIIAGCSSTTSTTTTSATTTSTTTTSTTTTSTTIAAGSLEAANTAASLSTPVADQGSPATDASSSVIPAELDTQSADWFAAVCQQLNVEIPTAEGDLPPQAVVEYVKSLSAAMVATAQIATILPPPTVGGGAELAGALAASMSRSGPDLAAKVDSYLADMDGANPYSADSSVLASQLSLRAALAPLTSLDPAVNAALGQFPACQTYGF